MKERERDDRRMDEEEGEREREREREEGREEREAAKKFEIKAHLPFRVSAGNLLPQVPIVT